MRLLSLCGVAGLVMLAAARAHADWRTDVSIPERPNDVLEVWEPGRFSVGHSQGAYLFADGGIALEIGGDPILESAGTYYQPAPDCFISANKDFGVLVGRRANGSPCGNFGLGQTLLSSGSLERVKHAANGGAVAVAKSDADFTFYLSEASIHDPSTFRQVSAGMPSPNKPVGVVRVGTNVHVLIASALNTAVVYRIDSTDLGRAESLRQTAGTGVVESIDMFAAGAPAKPYAVVGTQTGLLQGSALLSSTDSLRPVLTLEGKVSSVSMNVGFGTTDVGQGFGMAIEQRPDGSRRVLSPVPMASDTQAGTVWQARSLPASIATAPLKQVACTGASYCVLTADRAAGGNIFIYSNEAGPELSVSAPGAAVVDTGPATLVTLDEGQSYPLTFAAQDRDGDPVLVAAAPPSVSTGGWTAVPAAGNRPGEPVVWSVTTAAACKNELLGTFNVSASDGLARHEAYENVQVHVKHTRLPEAPVVELSDGGVLGSGSESELFPGGPPMTLRMAGNGTTAAGCGLTAKWVPLFSGTGVPSLAHDGGTAVITPPAKFCAPDAESFAFQLQVTDEGGLPNSKDFHVRLQTERMPFSAGALQLGLLESPSPDVLRVNVGSTLNCLEERIDDDLRAELWLEPLGGGERMQLEKVKIPSTWEASLAAGCGRPLLLKGVMEKGEGGPRSPELVREVETPWVETGLEPLSEVPPLVARCGEQARVTLTQTFPPGACQTPDVSWTQEGGPALEPTPLLGRTVSLVTRDKGLDSLVGESLVMRVTASAGEDNEVSHQLTLPITVEPFVKVRRRTEVPAASDTGLVGVSVDLLNTTACDVSGVSYVERLEGLTYVEGSAKFDGQPVGAAWEAGALTVTELTLAGEGTGTLTYVARPHLVGERRMEGEARLRNELISLSDNPGPQVPDSGCGCSGSGPGPVLFALGALVAAVRRRRR